MEFNGQKFEDHPLPGWPQTQKTKILEREAATAKRAFESFYHEWQTAQAELDRRRLRLVRGGKK